MCTEMPMSAQRLAEVKIDGDSASVLREDLEELAATPATTAVHSCWDRTNGSSVGAGPTAKSCGLGGGHWSAVRQAALGQAYYSRRENGPGEPQPNQGPNHQERARCDR